MYEDLTSKIPTAAERKAKLNENEDYRKDLEKHIKYINENVERAVKQGRTHTCFNDYGVHEKVIKKMLLDRGYTFRPTGVVGGVWQLSEEICWD